MSETPSGATRRTVLTSAGIAGAAGLGMTTPATAAHGGVALGRPGETVVEFRGRISQSGSAGETFTSNGFLTAVAGLTPADLFAGSPPAVGTALYTAHASGELAARVLDQSVHALDIAGEMSVYLRGGPGADWSDPGSFTSGTLVARYALSLQDVLAVFAPARGLPTLTGEMAQTAAGRVPGAGRFGAPGTLLRMFATGLGQLVDPVTLNADLEIAGNWSVP
ncbi:MAG: hypothetical protein ACXV0U_05575 [Kineosporiaceae bacterium]